MAVAPVSLDSRAECEETRHPLPFPSKWASSAKPADARRCSIPPGRGAPRLGVIWFWVSAAGVEPALIAALSSFPGRLFAAAVGTATVAALVRAFMVWRLAGLDQDGTLL